MNVADPLCVRAREQPHGPAIITADRSVLSAAALDRAIDATAARLLHAGWTQGAVATLDMAGPDELSDIILCLALARLGIVSAASSHGAPPLPPGLATLTDDGVPHVPAAPDPGLLRIMASSGTTGRPKPIPITHANQAARVEACWAAYGRDPGPTLIAIGLGSSAGLTTLLATLWAGGTILLTSPADAYAALLRTGATSILAAPNTLAALLATIPPGAPPPPTLSTIRCTGSATPPALAAALRARLCPTLLCHYGSTEAGLIAHGPLHAGAGDSAYAGHLAQNVQAEALGPDGAPLPPGQPGSIRLRTPTMAEGFDDGWFQGGDIGAIAADGAVRLLGRADEVINAGGHKFLPALVEDALLELDGVAEAACFGVLSQTGRVEVWAAITGPAPVPKPQLDAACRGLGAATPATVVQLRALPRNANGKLLRTELSRQAALLRSPA